MLIIKNSSYVVRLIKANGEVLERAFDDYNSARGLYYELVDLYMFVNRYISVEVIKITHRANDNYIIISIMLWSCWGYNNEL